MQFRQFFIKVSKRHESPGAFLYLIQEEEGFTGYNLLSFSYFQALQNPSRVKAFIEVGTSVGSFLEIDHHRFIEQFFSEAFYAPGFSYLPGALQNQGLPSCPVLP
jgi:hypothetical protein